ncbi:MAG: aminotransferase class V-fold PLP-dependent enzyme [Gemmataceae bacterium]|nr:aminotransferase class V-fold PLP-dependent enzyme [Gemmataceae bacterium]
MAGDEGGGLYFDSFLANGFRDCPSSFTSRYPGLNGWRGVGRLKAGLRSLAGSPPESPVLLASRSTALMRFAARLLYHPCRNVLTTDLDWPPYKAILAAEAAASGRSLTEVPLREGVLSGRLTEDELIALVCNWFGRAGYDGLYLTAVNNLGVRFPVEKVVRRLEAVHTVRTVVVDGAQEFCHLPSPLGSEVCDLYLAGSHKWLRGHHPLGMAFYGRPQSRGRVQTVLARGVRSGEIDDPLLRFTARLESGTAEHLSETVNLTPLFSTNGALADASDSAGAWRTRMRNLEAAAAALVGVGWNPLLAAREFRSGILLVRAEGPRIQAADSDSLRAALREAGVAATTYPGGLVRLSMPSDSWRPGELDHLGRAFKLLA